ncbi:MAG TPA: thioredoxin family protein [Ktedonosporobacter sp.]|nr:thioredoxin family protein [Ktedonosporobacter sp.]
MLETIIRLAILLGACLLIWLLVWGGRSFVAQRRQRALSATPLDILPASLSIEPDQPRVHILAFSSEDCHQCHQLQAPALKRVLAARGDTITVTEIDATTETEIAHHYQVLTVPTTVLLDEHGKAHAVNYGFANTQHLLEQIDEILQPAQK